MILMEGPYRFPYPAKQRDLHRRHCSLQAFGAKNFSMLGVVLQQATLILWLTCIPIGILWFQVTPSRNPRPRGGSLLFKANATSTLLNHASSPPWPRTHAAQVAITARLDIVYCSTYQCSLSCRHTAQKCNPYLSAYTHQHRPATDMYPPSHTPAQQCTRPAIHQPTYPRIYELSLTLCFFLMQPVSWPVITLTCVHAHPCPHHGPSTLLTSPACPSLSLIAAQVEPLLLALQQPPVIAKMAARYLLLVVPTLPLMAVRETVTHYLIAQQVAGPGLVVNIITVMIAPLYSYLLLFRCDYERHRPTCCTVAPCTYAMTP
jgi:hypothetical protein